MDRLVVAAQRRPRRRHRRGRGRHHRSQRRRVQPRGRRTATSRTSSRCFNAQTPITPVDYETGTTLDGTPNGTGPWKLDQLRPGHRRDVRAQPGLVGRPDPARRPGDAVLRRRRHDGHGDAGRRRRRPRAVLGASAATPCSTAPTSPCSRSSRRRTARSGCAATPASSSTRRVRQALAYTFDREQMVSTLFQGRAEVGNDHVIAPFMPFFDDVASPQRDQGRRDGQAAAGRRRRRRACRPTLHAADLQEIPELAQLIQAGAAEAGINLEIAIESLRHVLRRPVVPGRAGRPAVLRRRRAGHRRLRPPARRPTCSSTPR